MHRRAFFRSRLLSPSGNKLCSQCTQPTCTYIHTHESHHYREELPFRCFLGDVANPACCCGACYIHTYLPATTTTTKNGTYMRPDVMFCPSLAGIFQERLFAAPVSESEARSPALSSASPNTLVCTISRYIISGGKKK